MTVYDAQRLRRIANLPPKPGKAHRGRPSRVEVAQREWAKLEARMAQTGRKKEEVGSPAVCAIFS